LSKESPSADARSERLLAHDDLAPLRPAKLVLAESGSVGEALRAARESLGLAVEDIALVTRVRAAYIADLETFDLDRLPARPFAIGYVRAYAQALGLDAEAVVARFRAEAPEEDDALREPVSARYQRHRRFGGVAVGIGVIVAGFVGWNLFQHAKTQSGPSHAVAAAPRSATMAPPDPGPAHLGAPPPAPPEATTPPAYETPGLAAAVAAKEAAASGRPPVAVAASPAVVDTGPVGVPFAPQGAVYGAPRGGQGVILQARGATTVVVRATDGQVYFARQLSAGEAWRAPDLPGLTVEVGNPSAIEVYAQGLSKGPLTDTKTALSTLSAGR